jgi:hypothetical protein
MPDVKISQLPAGTANASAVVPATNAAGTTTEKLTLSAILALQHNHSGGDITSGTVAAARLGAHASGHQTGGADAIANVVSSPSQLTADQNDYALPTADIVRMSASAARNVTGFAAGSSGQALLLVNVGSFAITLKHQSTSSSAANRLVVPWAGDYVMDANGGAALVIYDATTQRWRVV